MNTSTSTAQLMAADLCNRLESLLLETEEKNEPLEMDPYRSQLFELFVTADATGYTADDSEPDLSADGLCKVLAERWELGNAAKESVAQQTRMSPEQLSRMRLLWSMMRMWMEWTYAWKRYPEFRNQTTGQG